MILGLVGGWLISGSPALAGPNAFGVLLLHANEALTWSVGNTYCGQSALMDCAEADVRVDTGDATIVYALAAFPPDASPRLAGLTFGINYDVTHLTIAEWGVCGDFSLPTGDFPPLWSAWPLPNSGISITWEEAQTTHVTEVAWFVAYAYTESPNQLRIGEHPTAGASFGDDTVPTIIDRPADFGALGFHTAGYNPCLTAWDCTLSLTPAAVTTYAPCAGSFPLDLNIQNVDLLGRFSVCTGFDDALLAFESSTIIEPFLESTGRDIEPFSPSSCNPACAPDGVTIGAALLGSPPGPTGSGPLARLRFSPRSTAAGSSSLCLDSWSLENTAIPFSKEIYVADATGVSITQSAYCYGDFNADGDVTVLDLIRNIPRWAYCAGDPGYQAIYDTNLLEGGNYCASAPDGCIDVIDIQTVAGRWHQGCSGAGAPNLLPSRGTSGTGATLLVFPATQGIPGEAGDLASIDLRIQGASALGAFETQLSFDPAVLQVTQVEPGDLLASTARTIYALPPRIDNLGGTVKLGACTTGLTPGASGDGLLARVVFEILDCNVSSEITIVSAQITDPSGETQTIASTIGGVIEVECSSGLPSDLNPAESALLPCRPNPTANSTELRFLVGGATTVRQPVQLAIFDATGRQVRKLFDAPLAPGPHQITWDGRGDDGRTLPNGAYFSRLSVSGKSYRQQIVITR